MDVIVVHVLCVKDYLMVLTQREMAPCIPTGLDPVSLK